MDQIHLWADRLEDMTTRYCGGLLDRVRVLASTASTQDAAFEAAGGRPGLVLVTGRQTGGRGRLGRTWHDDDGLGIAMSLVITARLTDSLFSLRVGLAAMHACDAAIGRNCRLRWPNDVLEPGEGGRKLAGVLIEVRQGLAVIGIGINVHQPDKGWPAELHGRAVSLAEIGSDRSRIDVMCNLLKTFSHALELSPSEVIDSWRDREWLIGQWRKFRVGQQTISGTVLDIEPDGRIALRQEKNEVKLIDPVRISLVHDGS